MVQKEVERDSGKEIIPYHRPLILGDNELDMLHEQIEIILQSGQLTNGEYVRELETKIKQLYGVEYVIATSNCTMGLFLCFQYKSWNETIHMPNFTWISPYLCIPQRDKNFLDISKNTWNIGDYPANRKNLIFPTHTFGNIVELSRDYNVIYDGAHALGSKIKRFGVATVLSLAPTKLVTSCEGGLILTNEQYLADFVRYRRDKCARMSEIHAVIGLATLKHLDEVLEWKRTVCKFYEFYLPGQFQEIPIHSNYNTIGFLNTQNLKIPEWIEYKQYYEPVFDIELCPNAYEVYSKMICLPSWYGVDYKKIVVDILRYNKL